MRWIAEIGSNHNRDIDRCIELINTAADIGCTDVKFQLYRVNKLFAPELLNKSEKHRDRIRVELPLSFLPDIARVCRSRGLGLGCTPCYLEAVDELEPYVDWYKIASYDLTWTPLLQKVNDTGKPVILSTGMASYEEIMQSVSIFDYRDVTLMHCISNYPIQTPEDCNLRAIERLSCELDGIYDPVGYSDHSGNLNVILAAVIRWNADPIEFHLDLEDHAGYEWGGHCYTPDEIREVMDNVAVLLSYDGDGIKPGLCEADERLWRRDSDGYRPMRSIR